jgi:hypothetical protein
MVQAINRDNFSGRQAVTCWTCHRLRLTPLETPRLDQFYGEAITELDDVISKAEGVPTAAQLLDKYLVAIGGADKAAGITSIAATGKVVAFGSFGGGGNFEYFAQAPDKRAMLITFPDVPDRDPAARTYNGHEGWLRTPLTVLGEYQLNGSELDGARLDALFSFPQQIKTSLGNLKVSIPTTIRDLPGPSSQTSREAGAKDKDAEEHLVNVIQGTGPRGLLVTMYFDQKTGLLLRLLRYGATPIGRVPTQVDYADYRDVDGVKMPFRVMYAWLDGRDAIQISQIQTNVPIDAAKFGRPVAAKK